MDPSYRNPYNTAALLHHGRRRYHDEARELRRMLDLDPDDPYALFGLGRLAARRKQWREAEALFERSLASDDSVIDTHRAPAGVLVKLGREDDAIRAYERSLKLALNRGIPLAGPVATQLRASAHGSGALAGPRKDRPAPYASRSAGTGDNRLPSECRGKARRGRGAIHAGVALPPAAPMACREPGGLGDARAGPGGAVGRDPVCWPSHRGRDTAAGRTRCAATLLPVLH